VFGRCPPLFSGADGLFTQADIATPEPVIEQPSGGEPEPRQVADERRWFTHRSDCEILLEY
ncbi:hypothetical protein ACWGAZ_44985, partial [Streptomyces sp. NPDC055036]